jgi:hypothetical protein
MKQLLFIRYRKTDTVDAGGEQGTNTNYNALCQLLGEKNITVYYVHEKQSLVKVVLSVCSILINFLRGYYYGLSPHKVDQIVTIAQAYDYVFIDRSIFGVIAKALKENQYKGKIITFFHNVESVYFAAKINKYAPWRPIVINCVTKNDQESCDFSDIIIALNQRDKKEIETRYRRTPDILSPVVLKDSYNLPESETGLSQYPEGQTRNVPVCLFLGTYFPMNVHGILWFVKEVLPHVNIQLQIIGKGMKAILPKVKGIGNIEVFSDVPDLKPYIENADFMLFPVFEGSGMKVKTCEALMYGKNIIGTSEAFEGYALDYNKAGACCNTKEEFRKAIDNFSNHPYPRFNPYSRELFINNYSLEKRKQEFSVCFK